MIIPSHLLQRHNPVAKSAKRGAVVFDETQQSADAKAQITDVIIQSDEKRHHEERRQRQVKVILDTRSGRDRRASANRKSVNITA
jgi:hypothetical protein